jgi:predicted RNA-binding Zn-ribbon protein involved in translation (DUF1610 family)
MADAEFVKVTCPKCDALIATVPKDRPLKTNGLICSNCGAELTTSSPLERAAEKATRAIDKAESAIEKGFSRKNGGEK